MCAYFKNSTQGRMTLHSMLGPCCYRCLCCLCSSNEKYWQRNLSTYAKVLVVSTHLQISSRSLISCLGLLRNSWTMEDATMLLPVIAWRQQRPEHHVDCMDLEGKQLILNGFVEAETSNHSSQISSGPNQRRHHSQLLLVHERHNPVAGSFCHLHKEGEANKHSQSNVPWLGVVQGTEKLLDRMGEAHDLAHIPMVQSSLNSKPGGSQLRQRGSKRAHKAHRRILKDDPQ